MGKATKVASERAGSKLRSARSGDLCPGGQLHLGAVMSGLL